MTKREEIHKQTLTGWLRNWIASLSPAKRQAAYAQLRRTMTKARIKTLEGK